MSGQGSSTDAPPGAAHTRRLHSCCAGPRRAFDLAVAGADAIRASSSPDRGALRRPPRPDPDSEAPSCVPTHLRTLIAADRSTWLPPPAPAACSGSVAPPSPPPPLSRRAPRPYSPPPARATTRRQGALTLRQLLLPARHARPHVARANTCHRLCASSSGSLRLQRCRRDQTGSTAHRRPSMGRAPARQSAPRGPRRHRRATTLQLRSEPCRLLGRPRHEGRRHGHGRSDHATPSDCAKLSHHYTRCTRGRRLTPPWGRSRPTGSGRSSTASRETTLTSRRSDLTSAR